MKLPEWMTQFVIIVQIHSISSIWCVVSLWKSQLKHSVNSLPRRQLGLYMHDVKMPHNFGIMVTLIVSINSHLLVTNQCLLMKLICQKLSNAVHFCQ